MERWRDTLDQLTQGLQAFFQHHHPQASAIEVVNLVRVPGGGSRETWSFDFRWVEDGAPKQLASILQRSPDGGLLDTDREQEYYTLKALHGTGLAVPRVLWLDSDGTWLQRPSFLMERAPGRVGGRFLLDPEMDAVRPKLARQFVELAARLHMIDWRSLDLRFPDVPTRETAAAHQIRHWEETLDAKEMEPHPVLREAFSWLKRNQPTAQRLSIIHSDFKFENILFDSDRITALLDWEMVHVGDPTEDLAWTFRWYAMTSSVLPFDEYLRLYRELTGFEVDQEALKFYQVFTNVKAAIILLTGARAFVDGHTRSNPRPSGFVTMAIETIERLNSLRSEMEQRVAV